MYEIAHICGGTSRRRKRGRKMNVNEGLDIIWMMKAMHRRGIYKGRHI